MRREIHWGPRLLAPAAILFAATVAGQLNRAGLGPNDDPAATQPAARQPAATRSVRSTPPPPAPRPRRRVTRTYRIQEGDTFATIAADQGTSVERLQALNPDVDPNSLQVGQKIIIPR